MKKLRENARLRQQRFRQRRKEAATALEQTDAPVLKEKTTPRTRAKSETERQTWRDAKRKYREKMTPYQKAWNRRKDRERKREKKVKLMNSTKPNKSNEKEYRSRKTLYNATSKVRKVLPKTPEKFARVLNNLVQNSTPRKRQATENLMEMVREKYRKTEVNERNSEDVTYSSAEVKIDQVSSTPVETEVHHKKKNEQHERVKSEHQHGIHFPQWYRISSQTVRLVKNFYFREEVSTPLPQKRYANKSGPGYLMQVTLAVAFSMFKKEYKESKIGFTKFTSLRPRNVRLLTNKHWNFCVCTVCQNISYKLRAMTRVLKKIADFDQLLDILLCPRNGAQRYHLAMCLFQKCSKCADTKERLYTYFGNEKIQNKDSLLT